MEKVSASRPEFRDVAGSLHLTTSKHTGRYQRSTVVEPMNMSIKPGMFISSREPVPSYLPPQWSAHVHPEGQLYFYRDADLHIVTEANIYDTDILEKVNYWTEQIQRNAISKEMTLSNDVELFLQIEDNDCEYYFVDHISHTEFWLEPVDTEALSLSSAVSPAHLRLSLHELYWMHVEYFPMHKEAITQSVMEQLIGVFSHAHADQMTSRNSTFPYDEYQCAKFLKLLRTSRDRLNDGTTVCFVARLWHLVFRHRFSTHYGEQHARLCRDQAILLDTARESRQVGAVTALLSFKTSNIYADHLNDIYTDQLVYVHQWQPFIRKCLKDWKSQQLIALLSIMLHIPGFIPTNRPLSICSLFLFVSSLLSSVFLVHRHETLKEATASEALVYLNGVRSDRFKFQLVAFAYSLPKAFFFWGLAPFGANILLTTATMTAGSIPWVWCFGFVCICLIALAALHDITSAKKILRLPTFRWYKKIDLDTCPV